MTTVTSNCRKIASRILSGHEGSARNFVRFKESSNQQKTLLNFPSLMARMYTWSCVDHFIPYSAAWILAASEA